MAEPFARMHQRLFAHLGEEAVLRGAEPCRAAVEHGVAVSGEYGQVTGYRTVVEIDYAGIGKPQAGNPLNIGDAAYTLDAALEDDGYSARWIVR